MTSAGNSAVHAAIKKHKILGWDTRKSSEWGCDRFCTLESVETLELEVIRQLEEEGCYHETGGKNE